MEGKSWLCVCVWGVPYGLSGLILMIGNSIAFQDVMKALMEINPIAPV